MRTGHAGTGIVDAYVGAPARSRPRQLGSDGAEHGATPNHIDHRRPCGSGPKGEPLPGDGRPPDRVAAPSSPSSRTGSAYGTAIAAREPWALVAHSTISGMTDTRTGLNLFRRRRSRPCCARPVRCRGAPTSSAVPPRLWTIRRPSSSRWRPAPAWSSWCTTSCCWNVRHSAASSQQLGAGRAPAVSALRRRWRRGRAARDGHRRDRGAGTSSARPR